MTKDTDNKPQFSCNVNPNLPPTWDKVTIDYEDEKVGAGVHYASSSANTKAAFMGYYPMNFFGAL